MIQGATGPGGGTRDAVNYYPHHIGDYLRDTSHLTALEDGTYRRMLDLYYASEKPLPTDFDWLTRLVRAREEVEREAVKFILDKFFVKHEDGWHNKRADEEIRKGKARVKAAKTNGKRGGRPITQRVSPGLAKPNPTNNPTESSQNQNQNQNQRSKNTVGQKPDAIQVLSFLNEKTGRQYEPGPANLELILARLKEGATPDDLRAVIAKKCREWAGDEKMNQYLRPKTLFNRTNFAQYRGELSATEPQPRVAMP
jgi:uncharacterized phage protein (TIGR02220 family)